MEAGLFTTDMAIVLGLVCLTVLLFLTEWLRVDVVAIFVMVALPILGVIDGRDAFAGLSSNAVISIIAVIILGRGLDHTGVISKLMKPLMRLAGRSRSRIFILLAGTVAVISSFMQNVGAAALFLPAMRRLSRHSNIPLPQLLMPVGFSAILGGTLTLVGSSPLIMLNDLMRPYDLHPFSLFSVAPVGAALIITGIVYFMVAGKFLLPGGKPSDEESIEDLMIYYPCLGRLHEIRVPADATEILRVMDLSEGFGIHVVALATNAGRDVMFPPDRDMALEPGSTIAVFATPEALEILEEVHGVETKEDLELFTDLLSDDVSGVVEALVPQHSRLIGKTMADIRFRHNHLMAPLALTRGTRTSTSGYWDMIVHAGDSILMHGTWSSFAAMRPRRDLIFAQSLDHDVLHPEMVWRALGSFGLATAMVIFTSLPLSVCLMAGALGMILTRVLTIDEAYRGVDWRTVFLLGGLIPLGVAMQSTGTAAWIATHLMTMMGTPSPTAFIFIVGAISTVFTLVVSNVGAVVLLVPLVVGMAAQVGADPRLAALVVALAASNSFLLPTHQVNALYMGPGKYTSMDFIKAGVPLTILFLIVLTAMISLFY